MKELNQKIFSYLKKFPRGKITTYKFLAEKFHTSPRAVGMILKSNKDKSVPCYKVIRSNGKLGGYNRLLGKSKKELLGSEQVQASPSFRGREKELRKKFKQI